MKISEILSKYIFPVRPLPAGLFVKNTSQSNGIHYRSHLRITPNGDGIFILNASTIIHLNSTAAEYAYHFIKNDNADVAAFEVSRRYRIKKSQAKVDYQEFTEKINGLINQPDLDPISNFGLNTEKPSGFLLDAPLRLDCALTYHLPDSSIEEYSPIRRVTKELSTQEWLNIVDKSWREGVPHLVFTGGEPTLRNDLAEILAKAEINGQVTGLLTNGKKFVDKKYLETLLNSGLDHITIILPISGNLDLQSIHHVVSEDIFLTVHVTITPENREIIKNNLRILKENGVENISISAADQLSENYLKEIVDLAYSMSFHLVDGLPVPYSDVNPVSKEIDSPINNLVDDNCLYIEPDGDVLQSQGFSKNILGNILSETIQSMFTKSKTIPNKV